MPAISGPNWNGTGVDLPNTTGVDAGSGDSLPWGPFDMVFLKYHVLIVGLLPVGLVKDIVS